LRFSGGSRPCARYSSGWSSRSPRRSWWASARSGCSPGRRRSWDSERAGKLSDPLDLDALKDALRRRLPHRVAELDARYPGLRLADGPTRTLGHGDGPGPQPEGIRSADIVGLGEIAAEEAARDLRETLDILNRKARLLARLRLGAAIATALASASVIALVLGEEGGALIAAAVTLGGSLMGLILGYVEDFSGGEGSVRRFRDTLAEEHRRLTLARAAIRSADVAGESQGALAALRDINGVFAEVQFVRAKLGLAI
jgi:hypothetical protein